MKQCFSHRTPSHATLLSDPMPEDSAEKREKFEHFMKTTVLSFAMKKSRRKSSPPEPA